MFPYGAIIAANLLNNGEKRAPKQPNITTLGEYTTASKEEVYNKLVDAAKKVGIFEMTNIISKWNDFDSLSDVKKRAFLHNYASTFREKPTLFELIKDLFLN